MLFILRRIQASALDHENRLFTFADDFFRHRAQEYFLQIAPSVRSDYND